jgi:hypothetical protein
LSQPAKSFSPRLFSQIHRGIEVKVLHLYLAEPPANNKQQTMKSLTEQLWFEVPGRRGFVNITSTVENLVKKSGVKEGLCLVNAMHITASVFINDAEEVF